MSIEKENYLLIMHVHLLKQEVVGIDHHLKALFKIIFNRMNAMLVYNIWYIFPPQNQLLFS